MKILRSPAWLVAALVAVSVVVVERSVGGVLAGLPGALVGALAGLVATELGTLAGAVVFGMRVSEVVVGFGPPLREWHSARRTVSLRLIPVLLSIATNPGKPPIRLRRWLTALSGALLGVAAAVVLGVVAIAGDSAFVHGIAIGCAANIFYALVPRRTATSTSTGWRLFHRPSAEELRRLEAAPLAIEAIESAKAANLADARRIAGELESRFPDLLTSIAARGFVHVAHGEYSAAMKLLLALVNDEEQPPRDVARYYASLAGLTCAVVETGQIKVDVGLPAAFQAAEKALSLGYPSHRLTGTRALLALLAGDADTAIRLARISADASIDAFDRADDLATLARAHMAAGDNRAARVALAEAEKLTSWWPRVAATRSRLDIA